MLSIKSFSYGSAMPLAKHGALVDEDVGGGRSARRSRRPLDAHGIAALVAGQHDFNR